MFFVTHTLHTNIVSLASFLALLCTYGSIQQWDFIYLALFVFTDQHIEREQAESAANRLQMACEAFGDGMLPQLQSAVYKVP